MSDTPDEQPRKEQEAKSVTPAEGLSDVPASVETGTRSLEAPAATDGLIAYRDEVRGKLLRAARSAGTSRDTTSVRRQGTVSPVEAGEQLCELLYFDASYYCRGNPQLDDQVDALFHYLEDGWLEGRSPNALFDGDWYLAAHPEVAATGISPLSHYVRHGAAAGLQPHPLFDRAYYSRRYPDSLKDAPDAFQHFIRRGLQAGYAPTARIEALAQGRPVIEVLAFVLDEDLRLLEEPLRSHGWPAPVDDYWLPQALRDYIGDKFGQGPMDGMSYLFSVIAAYSARPDGLAESRQLQFLMQRARSTRPRDRMVRPDVSIIIPVHDNLVYTLTSIVSILEHKMSRQIEIIVGDDSSTDATPQVVEMLGASVSLVRHPTNLGFLQNCNACARRAEGRYLVFLNNDTIVLPGWLDELIAPLASDMNIGMTGSKLISGDGTLQEAGGILWADGSAWNYGRGGNPRLPHFSYSKDVDYCSGASIAIAKTLWDELGGFDPTFSPAYCEDSDLAFRVRAAGSRTWFAAASILVHHEGRSHGVDLETGVKAYQLVNQAKFLDRWRTTLTAENHPKEQNLFLARDRSSGKPHILVIDHYIPQWDRDAGSRTMLQFIKMFIRQGFHVIFWPDNLYEDRDYAKLLQSEGVEIIYGPQYVGGFEAWYKTVAEFVPYVLLSRPQIAETYIDFIDRDRCKVLFYGHDLHWKRLEKQWAVEKRPELREAMEVMRELEERICLGSDAVFYPSEEEIAVLTAELTELKAAAAVPAWSFAPSEIEAMRVRARRHLRRDDAQLIFIGGFRHQPNVDGIVWFATEVWPIIKAACKAANLTIVGSNPPAGVRRLGDAGQSITVVGQISDPALDRLYANATAAVVPLRFGGGVKGKVIEAFSKAVPVISTSIDVQGMHPAHDFCFVSDEPATFAHHVLHCINNPDDVDAKVLQAIQFLEYNYSLDGLIQSFLPFVCELDRTVPIISAKRGA